jgi:hypothetical protein
MKRMGIGDWRLDNWLWTAFGQLAIARSGHRREQSEGGAGGSLVLVRG